MITSLKKQKTKGEAEVGVGNFSTVNNSVVIAGKCAVCSRTILS